MLKKIIFLMFIFYFLVLPSFARIDGMVSQNHFYDNEKTIMTDIVPDNTIKTEKYWEKNLLHFNKYRPLFMLSNKELYSLNQPERQNVVQRVTIPSVYSISLKTSSVKNISLSNVQNPQPKNIQKQTVLTHKYEQAKNPDKDSDVKINTAIFLKNSNNALAYKLAVDLLDDVIRKEPYNAYAFYLKGEIYSQQKDFDKAIKNYIEALKINPSSRQCCLGIAKILENINKGLAQKYYDRAKLCER